MPSFSHVQHVSQSTSDEETTNETLMIGKISTAITSDDWFKKPLQSVRSSVTPTELHNNIAYLLSECNISQKKKEI